MIVPILVAVLLFVAACFLLRGKGTWLIAGYNTMSEAEKRRYDKKKLCRAVGVFLLLCSLGIGLLVLCDTLEEGSFLPPGTGNTVSGVFAAVMVIGAGFLIWYTNTKCKK